MPKTLDCSLGLKNPACRNWKLYILLPSLRRRLRIQPQQIVPSIQGQEELQPTAPSIQSQKGQHLTSLALQVQNHVELFPPLGGRNLWLSRTLQISKELCRSRDTTIYIVYEARRSQCPITDCESLEASTNVWRLTNKAGTQGQEESRISKFDCGIQIVAPIGQGDFSLTRVHKTIRKRLGESASCCQVCGGELQG